MTTLLMCLGIAAPSGAGEPIPDIDVILEQNPGKKLTVAIRPPIDGGRTPVSDVDVLLQKIPSGLAFDAVRLSGDRALRDLTIDQLPPGWGLQRKGRHLELTGPTVAPPIRFRLTAGVRRPARLDVELLADGKVGHVKRGIVPREVVARQVANTLSGTVQLPPRVSPGETLALRALPESNLPPGGAWVISGSVSEPWSDEDLHAARESRLDTARSYIVLEPAETTLTLQGEGGCEGLAPTAAALLARDNFETSKSSTVEWAAKGSAETWTVTYHAPLVGTDPAIIAAPLPPATASYHLLSRGKIGAGLRSSYAFALADGTDASLRTGFAIKEEDMPVETGQPVAIPEEGVSRVVVRGPLAASSEPRSSTEITLRTVDAERLAEVDEAVIVVASLAAEPVAGGCRFEPREPTELELLRLARRQRGTRVGKKLGAIPRGASGGAHLLSLPTDLAPGEPLSIRYLDEWGDPWVEVAEVPEVEVVPAEEPPPRRIEGAGRYVVAGRSVCVCGGFDALDIATPFRLGDQVVKPTSVGRTAAWLFVPSEVLGPQLIQAEGLSNEAATDAIRIDAELDQEHLFSGQQTPLRLTVHGTAQSIPIRLINRTPEIISLEGGNEQGTESSGGEENTLTRQVSAQQRGSFQLHWEVPPAPCPCTE